MEAFYNSNHSAWLNAADALRPGQDQQPSSTSTPTPNGDEWGKAATVDLSDFGLGDLQATSASPTSAMSMQHMYQFPSSSGYFTTMAPFNMIPYSQAAASAWPQQNLPISSYSTLNGATSSVGSQQQQHNQQSSSQPQSTQQPTIDPALTTQSHAASYSPPPSSSSQAGPSQVGQQSPPVQYSNLFQQHQQDQQQLNPHQNLHSPTVLAVPPVYLMQHQQQPQRTLNPQQLTMPFQYMYPMQQPMQNNLATSNTATPPPASSSTSSNSTVPTSSTPEVKYTDAATFKKTLDKLLTPAALSDANTVQRLMDAVADHSSARVTPEQRMDLACRIRDNAGNAFFAAWARDEEAMVLLVSWLKAGVTGKDDGRWECTIMPLLHVLDRLPLTIGILKEHRLGKLTTALLKNNVSPAIKDMASNIAKKWRNLIEPSSVAGAKEKDGSSTTSTQSRKVDIEDKTKKRKLTDVSSKPPSKVTVVSTGSSSGSGAKAVKVKKEKVVVTAVKDAKADASFFSAPRPKSKLPSFKKAQTSSTTSNTLANGTDIAQPNHEDPFQQALKEMRGRSTTTAGSSGVKAENALGDANVTLEKPATPDSVRNSKKRKSVSWAPEGHLEKVRIIEKAVYEDDHVNGTFGMHSIRDLERAEGAAMHIHLFEEVIDWYEPYGLEFPEDIDSRERGSQSEEKVTQEEREKITLGALYFAESDIPETPGEPAVQIPAEQVDSEVRPMMAGSEIQPFFQHAMSVADLVGQLAANPIPAAAGPVGGSYGIGNVENGVSSSSQQGEGVGVSNVNNALGVSGGFDFSKLDASALSSLAASLGLTGFNFGLGANTAPEANNSYSLQQDSSGWGAYTQQQQQQQQISQQPSYTDSSYTHDERDRDERSGGRGGFRGRGRGGPRGRGGGEFKSRRRCNYYAQGSCRFGDACHFSHEGPPGPGPQGYYD